VSTGLIVGIDVGGTKTHLRAERATGELVVDRVVPTSGWETTPEAKAGKLTALIGENIPGNVGSLAVGAHGSDTDEDCAELAARIEAQLHSPTVVVNDSLLLGPAAGYDRCISLVAGTGSIALGRDAGGATLYTGGWGWLVGDEGSAWGIVREAIRLLTRASDRGTTDQVLLAELLDESTCETLRDLVATAERRPAAEWARWVPAVFRAASAGAPLALEAVFHGAQALSTLVTTLLKRGAMADAVVAAGGVIINQPGFAKKVEQFLAADNGLPLVLYSGAPVKGAVKLARLQMSRQLSR
jgi:N-acetylglucosamine kinase-like BadF-type ATPase